MFLKEKGLSIRAIARTLNRTPSTISQNLKGSLMQMVSIQLTERQKSTNSDNEIVDQNLKY
jgi:IS30 family transposase